MKESINILLIEDEYHHVNNPFDAAAERGISSVFRVKKISHNHISDNRLTDHASYHALIIDIEQTTENILPIIHDTRKHYPHLPIIALTSHSHEHIANELLTKGADDYLMKDEIHEHALRRIIRYSRKTREDKEKIAYLSQNDCLTGLINGNAILASVKHAIQQARVESLQLATYIVDLDNFKAINEQYGYDIGNSLISDIATRLVNIMPNHLSPGRLSGDRFIITQTIQNHEQAVALAETIKHTINCDITLNDTSFTIKASMGIALFPHHGDNHDELI